MRLLEVMRDRGYRFRQHLEEEGWGCRKLTVVDLSASQQAALDRGGVAELKHALNAQGSWTFPATDVIQPAQRAAEVTVAGGDRAAACIVAPTGAAWRALAAQLADALAHRLGRRLDVVGDQEDLDQLLASRSVILLGGSDENVAARQLALRYRTGFVDASVPGDGGWLVTTHAGLNAAGHNALQITAAPDHHAVAVACVMDRVTQTCDIATIGHTHRVEQGPKLKARFPSWERFAARLQSQVPHLQTRPTQPGLDPVALSHLLAEGLDSGGPEKNLYNAAPIDLTITAARFFQISADPRGLALFREMLFRLVDYYLLTLGGASYPSDIDFRIGTLLLYFARLEHLDIFSDADRLLLVNLLLACMRAVYEYTIIMWPIDAKQATRFNHQTFKALSLSFAADYFDRYGIADVHAWRRYSDNVFIDGIWKRSKQTENAGTYELFVYDHAAAWRLFRKRPLEPQQIDCLKKVVHRQIAATDNFLKPVDYGDASLNMEPVCAGMARLVALHDPDPRAAWFAEQDLIRGGNDLPLFLHEHPGLRRQPTCNAPEAGEWEWTPLDAAFAADYAPGLDPARGFDKLAYRTGWNDRDQYLLWEGVGNLQVGHSHNEVNGIVRLNDRGRHWLVSNGYGRRTGVTNAGLSFTTRVRGPEDHNMLVLKRDGDSVHDLPACATLHRRVTRGPLSWATACVADYGGVDWLRTVLICRRAYVLIIDRVRIKEPRLEGAHVEWNVLGACRDTDDGFLLEQQGVFLHVAADTSWAAHHEDADRSACWKQVLESGQYPYAKFPLNKFVFAAPRCEANQTHSFVTLLATSESAEPPFTVRRPNDGCIVVIGAHPAGETVSVRDGDLSIDCEAGRCEIGFDAAPVQAV